ncbi:hypothetical protein BGW42_004797 [Actinomortierella wolfii]|nr:hypothetical protein BGW42_004797 [Actinomortierella wolfii]
MSIPADFDLEKHTQHIHLVHTQQHQQHDTIQPMNMHAHLEPENVRVTPFRMEMGMTSPMDPALQPGPAPANPAPFGLCGMAVTAFCMAFYNMRAGVHANAPVNYITGLAFFYGGFGQLIAGLLEFRNGNTFGGTTFCSYGMYWISYSTLLIPFFGVSAAYADNPDDLTTSVGIYMLAWTIFTFLMFTLTWKSNLASAALFFWLGLTYLLSTVASLAHLEPGNAVSKTAGVTGLITSSIAFYCAMADLSNKSNSYYTLPLGQLGRR